MTSQEKKMPITHHKAGCKKSEARTSGKKNTLEKKTVYLCISKKNSYFILYHNNIFQGLDYEIWEPFCF